MPIIKGRTEPAATTEESGGFGPSVAGGTTTGVARPGRPAQGRAFLVQLAPDCQHDEGELSGRVQHLETFDGGNFDSAEGLLALLRRVLGRAAGQNTVND